VAERISDYSFTEVVGTSCAGTTLTHVDCDGNNLCVGLCPLAATIADSCLLLVRYYEQLREFFAYC